MRTLVPAAVTALGQPLVPLATLVEMMLSTPLRLNSSSWNLTYGGNVYNGTGTLGAIDPIDDSPGEVKGLRFTLAGVASDFIALALAEPVQGRLVTVSTAIFDPATGSVLDVSVDWVGRLDVFRVAEDTESATLQVTAEHVGIDLLRPVPIRYSHADQQLAYAGDRGFEYVLDQSDQAIVWPAASFYRV